MCTRSILRTSLALVLAVICGAGVSADELEERREVNRVAWNAFLDAHCTTNMSEQAVRKLMDKKHRAVAFARANDEIYRLLFLVDDDPQIEFAFHNNRMLLTKPFTERKGHWVRQSDGTTISIPDPAEAAAKVKVEKVALAYVAKETKYRPEELTAHGMRGFEKHTWVVSVTLDNLEVDAPQFLVPINAAGEVEENRGPFSATRK